ncbi:unnamed protein product [marine sediment metagenome]|uniref:Uncharacterized protein n=1 Tax=marine sediment metagenome TaxID=412755 RepID=X1RAU2_9ZZZZ
MAQTDWKRAMLEGIPRIEEQFKIIGGPMTLRRVFYLFVAAELIKNNHGQYQQLSDKLSRAREQGIVPWKHIFDGSRSMVIPDVYDPDDWQIPKPDWFMRDPTSEQKNYVECWVEKAGNIPILSPICKKYFVRLVSTAGRTSVTYKHDGAQRFLGWDSKPGTILYVSDLDADGEHFVTETRKYINHVEGVPVSVKKIILTHDQVKKHKLPILHKNYSKSKNKRFVQDFLAEFGSIQVEIDALSVDAMRATLEAELSNLLSLDVIEQVREQSIEDAKDKLQKAIAEYQE